MEDNKYRKEEKERIRQFSLFLNIHGKEGRKKIKNIQHLDL